MSMHFEIQEYLKELLEYYDFTVEKERYISTSERIDLYGYSKPYNKTIGIEITFTSDVRKDAERLARFGFDCVYIIVDNPAYEGKIEYHGKVVPIVHYNSFESELRRVLNVSLTFPRFGSFEAWKEKGVKLSEPAFTEGKLDEFIQTLKNSGLDTFVEDAINLVGILYIAREIPSKCRDPVAYRMVSSRINTNIPEYQAVIDPKILSILENFGLVNESARGSGELRKYFAYLTKKGEEIGREIIINRINKYSKELNNIINEFGKMASIIVVGTVERYSREQQILSFKLIEKGLLECADCVGYRSFIDERVEVGLKNGKKQEIHPLLTLICYSITYYNYSESVRFFNRLKELGLACEVQVYDSRARYTHNEIRSPIEVLEYIFSRRPIVGSEVLLDFGSLTTVLAVSKIKNPKVARETFEECIKYYEVPVNRIKAILDELNNLGITSKYIELPDCGPFLVFDEKGFEEIMKKRLVEAALKFLR